MVVKRCTSSHHEFQGLVQKLDAELAIYNGDKDAFYSQFNGIESLQHCVIALDGDTPAASGAIKQFDKTSAEIKRM